MDHAINTMKRIELTYQKSSEKHFEIKSKDTS